jgi:hypothetical protein
MMPILKEIIKVLVREEGEKQTDFDDENDSDLNEGIDGPEALFSALQNKHQIDMRNLLGFLN